MLSHPAVSGGAGLSAEALAQIASESWACLTHVGLEVGNGAQLPAERCLGWIHLTGGWTGVVTLECSRHLAMTTAADVFELEDDAVNSAHASDIVGEVVNMVCGGLKKALGCHARISMPCVTLGRDISIGFPGKEYARVALRRGDEQLYLTIYH